MPGRLLLRRSFLRRKIEDSRPAKQTLACCSAFAFRVKFRRTFSESRPPERSDLCPLENMSRDGKSKHFAEAQGSLSGVAFLQPANKIPPKRTCLEATEPKRMRPYKTFS